MNEHNQQVIGNIGVLLLSIIFGALGWTMNHRLMRHGLLGAALWTGEVFAMRMITAVGWLKIEEARIYNGWFAWVIVSILVSATITEWWIGRRIR